MCLVQVKLVKPGNDNLKQLTLFLRMIFNRSPNSFTIHGSEGADLLY